MRSIIDQYGDHTYIASQRNSDFDGNKIIRIKEPALTVFVSGIYPVGTDNGYEEIARGNLIVEMIYEVDARRNMVDIHEKIFPPKSLGKPIMEPTGHTGRVVSAVIDENLTSHDLPKGFQWRCTITQNEKEHYYWLHLLPCRPGRLSNANLCVDLKLT